MGDRVIMPDDDYYSPYAPMNNINNLGWWVSADLSQKTDNGGGSISPILDLRYNYSFTNPEVPNQPVLMSNSLFSFLRFQTLKSLLGPANILPLGNNPYTYLVVGLNRADGADAAYVLTTSVSTDQSLILRRRSGNVEVDWFNNILSAGAVNDTDFYVIITTWDGTTRSIYIDGILAGSDTPGARNGQAATQPALGYTVPSVDVDLSDVMMIYRSINPFEIAYLSKFFMNKIGK